MGSVGPATEPCPSPFCGDIMSETPIRHAATMILVRNAADAPSVLMGQRSAGAAFMPGKFVFPGGAVDGADAAVPLAAAIPEHCAAQLAEMSYGASPEALVAAAIRELWEETGQILGRQANWSGAPQDWASFASAGYRPDPTALSFVFRALTPPGRSRRFDARFFLADAEALASDPDDFSPASDELSHLQWIPFSKARSLDLPFITSIVLAEIASRLPDLSAPENVPFFLNNEEESLIKHLGGPPA